MLRRAVPKFTLFTGPSCSLCDIAKAELKKVRESRPFELETINIQDRGHRRWKKLYGWWIPVLHLEGQEVAKGDGVEEGGGDDESPFPFAEYSIDITPQETISSDDVILYDTSDYIPIGEETVSDDADEVTDSRRCFNCGSPSHGVSSCPEPRNPELIALSRQMFQFYNDSTSSMRFHEGIGKQLEKLSFIDEFQPGRVQGYLLREALDLDEEQEINEDYPWYYNMMRWGYPPGYYSRLDPKTRCRSRILDVDALEISSDDDDLAIFGEDETDMVHGDILKNSDSQHEDPENGAESGKEKRWVTYSTSLFLSDILPVYSRAPLPDPESTKSATFTSDREDLWQRLIREQNPVAAVHKPQLKRTPPPPWRWPGCHTQERSSSSPALDIRSSPSSRMDDDEAEDQDMDVSD
ncbi:hypothetical protein SISSUDRAFT_1032763 [Sistotremastrum suecicum HHB10207 ss-3]|uniref:CCHC-type domain-containing protein n=1 Tax=Sistotremastrum suecicum HHB10207 ss-3 TaxID=1314776 RepID=A0A166E4W2_9AGAM|nr:hypothetical protein SISSUDRAFT_1032763 [Sistotremastrum suecicum HHB10207 ss-3]